MTLLIACGGSTDAAAIVADLRRAALPAQTEAVVLAVADLLPTPDPPPGETGLAAVSRARDRVARELETARGAADAAAAQLRTAFPDWHIAAEAQADSPAWAIVRRATDIGADLIVVGSHDHSALGRVLLGSVSQAVLTQADRSVRIARPPAGSGAEPPRVLIGADGSSHANAAVWRVAARPWPAGTQVRVVTVLDDTLASMLGGGDTEPSERAAAQRIAEDAARPLSDAGLATSSAVVDGRAKRALVDEATRWRADCVFVGARGLRGVERFVLGSVSAAVAARADCSVEVVRP